MKSDSKVEILHLHSTTNILRKITLSVFLCFFAICIFISSRHGHDTAQYVGWISASLTGDIFSLPTSTLSLNGTPYYQWSPTVGYIYGLLPLIGFGSIAPADSMVWTGFVYGLLFWALTASFISKLVDDGLLLSCFFLLFTFIATHAGLYTHTYSSECLTLLFIGVIVNESWNPKEKTISPLSVASLLGAFILLCLIRLQSVVLIFPVLVGIFERVPARSEFQFRRDGKKWGGVVAICCCFGAIAIAQVFSQNKMMTGSWLRSPYLLLGEGFKSPDLTRPDWRLFFHPFHGWWTYHPFYAIGSLSLAACMFHAKAWKRRLYYFSWLLSVIFSVWIIAGYTSWYGGETAFGQRYLAGFSVLFVAGWITTWSNLKRQGQSKGTSFLLFIGLAAGIWSYIVLNFLGYNTPNWSTWVDKFSVFLNAETFQPWVAIVLPSVIISSLLSLVWKQRSYRKRAPVWLRWVTSVLAALILAYYYRSSNTDAQLSPIRHIICATLSPILGFLPEIQLDGGQRNSRRISNDSVSVIAACLSFFLIGFSILKFLPIVSGYREIQGNKLSPPREFLYHADVQVEVWHIDALMLMANFGDTDPRFSRTIREIDRVLRKYGTEPLVNSENKIRPVKLLPWGYVEFAD